MPINLKGSRKEGPKYMNPVPTHEAGFDKMPSILWDYMTNKAESVPKKKLGPFKTNPEIFNTPPESGLRITWIGHSSILIEIDGKRILTDPVWSERASFSKSFGPKRFFEAPIALDDLPALDAIIVSHDHYDHFDEATIKHFINLSVPFYTSLGVGFYLEKWGIAKDRITEMDWGDTAKLGDDMTITTTPTRHFSGRGITHRNETLWSAFVIKGNKHNIFFGADSGWFEGFADIGEAYGPFDLTMLEIGAYGKNWPDIHMGPDHASNAHLALKGGLMMPIHWGTFNLALHAWYEPIERLQQLAKEKQIRLFAPEPGQPTQVNDLPFISGWWRKYR
jgi:L-ascorbate metabolism protein UlaG (beta-lactamase superfamily)